MNSLATSTTTEYLKDEIRDDLNEVCSNSSYITHYTARHLDFSSQVIVVLWRSTIPGPSVIHDGLPLLYVHHTSTVEDFITSIKKNQSSHVPPIKESFGWIELFEGSEKVYGRSLHSSGADDVDAELNNLQNEMKRILTYLKQKYNDDINAVTVSECTQIESLERKICRILYKQVPSTALTGVKFIGVLADLTGNNHQFLPFVSKEEASEWSFEIQKQMYSDITPWHQNPFSVGAYFDVSADDTDKQTQGDFLCLSNDAININIDIDIRQHTNIPFEVMLKDGSYCPIPEQNILFSNGELLGVIIDTGAVKEFNMHLLTSTELRKAASALKKRVASGSNTIIENNVELSCVPLRIKYLNDWKNVQPVLNRQGTAIGIPGFEHFQGIFTLDTVSKRYEFVPRPEKDEIASFAKMEI